MTLEGRKVLLGLQLGSRESYEDWLDFARDLSDRGLRCPALVVADGAPGLWKAIGEAWPRALGQRCTVHKLRNLLAKLPERLHREVKARYWAALDECNPAAAKAKLATLAADYAPAYPRSPTRSSRTSTPWLSTCASPTSTAIGRAARTCSSAPSSRCAGARRSLAASRARLPRSA